MPDNIPPPVVDPDEYDPIGYDEVIVDGRVEPPTPDVVVGQPEQAKP